MALVNTVRSRPHAEGLTQVVHGKFTFSGTYPTGGEPVTMSAIRKGTNKRPIRAIVNGASQNNLYMFDDNNNKLVVRVQGTPPTELPAGAYPASVTGDAVEYTFIFPKF